MRLTPHLSKRAQDAMGRPGRFPVRCWASTIEFARGARLGFAGVHALSDEVAGAHVDVEADLVVDVGPDARGGAGHPEEAGKTSHEESPVTYRASSTR